MNEQQRAALRHDELAKQRFVEDRDEAIRAPALGRGEEPMNHPTVTIFPDSGEDGTSWIRGHISSQDWVRLEFVDNSEIPPDGDYFLVPVPAEGEHILTLRRLR